jgi:hypothetical protein
LAAGAETCSLLLTVRLTAAARAEDSARCRRRLALLPPKPVAPNLLARNHAA